MVGGAGAGNSLMGIRDDKTELQCLQASVEDPPDVMGENLTLKRRFSS